MAGTMATRCGGRSVAGSHCVAPTYEKPYMPTFPLEPGSLAAHVLDHDQVAVLGVERRRSVHVGLRDALVVGQAHEEDRHGPLDLGAIDVRVQDRAVSHACRNVGRFGVAARAGGRLVGRWPSWGRTGEH